MAPRPYQSAAAQRTDKRCFLGSVAVRPGWRGRAVRGRRPGGRGDPPRRSLDPITLGTGGPGGYTPGMSKRDLNIASLTPEEPLDLRRFRAPKRNVQSATGAGRWSRPFGEFVTPR